MLIVLALLVVLVACVAGCSECESDADCNACAEDFCYDGDSKVCRGKMPVVLLYYK